MKKKILRFTIALVIMMSLTTTAFAKIVYSDFVKKYMNRGYSAEDAYGILAIIALSEENASALVEQKYKELKDWEKVTEHYGVDFEEFNTFVENQLQAAKAFEIPDDIYEEMKASGMKDEDCIDFARSSFNARIDVKTTWEARKKGKTINDLIKERTALKNAQGQAVIDFVYGDISEKEYLEKMQKLSPDMPMSEIIEFAAKERKETMKLKKEISGITDEEIAFAEKAGVTDFLAICRIKQIEGISNLSYKEMVLKVQKGEPIDKVIKDNISKSKVEALKAEANEDVE